VPVAVWVGEAASVAEMDTVLVAADTGVPVKVQPAPSARPAGSVPEASVQV
jgi:hypothetical protein